MKNTLFATGIAMLLLSPTALPDGGEAELVGYMTKLQYFSHKLGLSVDAGNQDLQRFYAHEVEEQMEAAMDIEELDGIPIARLVKQFLLPSLEKLEDAIESGDAGAINGAYDALIESCNGCHEAAKRPYLLIRRSSDNPYAQTFAP